MNRPGTQRPAQLLRDAFPERPEMGAAISRALLEQVASGERGETIRLSRPGRVVAFGRRDAVDPGYADAVHAARDAGYRSMERLAGGRAALYFEGTLSLTRTVADEYPARRTQERFQEMCEVIRDAFIDLGVDARIGEVEGEYCPGAYSVNAGGRVKLAGVGQRMITGAAHTGVVIVVENSAEVRRVLTPVYAALSLDWEPETAGALAEEMGPGSADGIAAAESALLQRLAEHWDLGDAETDGRLIARTEEIAERYVSQT